MVRLNNYNIPNRFCLQLIRGINNSNIAFKMPTLLSNNKYVYIVHNVKNVMVSKRRHKSLLSLGLNIFMR